MTSVCSIYTNTHDAQVCFVHLYFDREADVLKYSHYKKGEKKQKNQMNVCSTNDLKKIDRNDSNVTAVPVRWIDISTNAIIHSAIKILW